MDGRHISSPGIAYRLLSLPLLLLWLLHAIRHGAKHGLSGYLSMRFLGQTGDSQAKVWVHAASVGEVEAATPLVRALVERGEKLLFTSFTASGLRAIRKNFGDDINTGVIPVDFYWQCQRFFKAGRIKLGLIMETELWPELLYQARIQNIPLLQINARLSRKSTHTPAPVRRVLLTCLGYFSKILTRSAKDRDSLLAMGADAESISICGNLKSLTGSTQRLERLIKRDYLILASSHEGEEQQFLQQRPAETDGPLLVIAPRHPQRSPAIQAQIAQLGLSYAVRSQLQPIDEDTQVYLADTLGELKPLMAHARIVIMGGSFDDTGGHNLLEPASLGCAVITGPSNSNIAEDIAMLGEGSGVLQVNDMQQCWQQVSRLLENPDLAQALATEAKARLTKQPDVIAVYLGAIEAWL